jgi:DNA polymerase-3 subunit delta'
VAYLRKVIEGKCVMPLLLVGDEGVGRRFSVKAAVKEAFAEGDPKNPQCAQVERGVHPDFVVLEPDDGMAIGVDAAREILEFAYQYPAVARKRFILIDGVDQLTSAAANALLKTLEEPPEVTQFFLLAKCKEAVLPTIVSRCGEVRYNRLSEAFITSALSQLTTEPSKAHVYARLSEGSMGRAIQFIGANRLSLRDRVLSLLKTAMTGDLSVLFSAVDALEKDMKLVLRFMGHILVDLGMLANGSSVLTNVDIVDDLHSVAKAIGRDRILRMMSQLDEVAARMHAKINVAFHVKVCFASVFVG